MKIELSDIFETIKQWKTTNLKSLNVEELFVFGSSVYQNGKRFNSQNSDLDLLVVIPDNINTAIERIIFLKALKQNKKVLEANLFDVLNRENATSSIVSLLPVTKTEILYDIHKGESRNFFSSNIFYDLNNDTRISLDSRFKFQKIDNELLIQSLEVVQRKRNLYLKNSVSKDYKDLDWKGVDLIPKELARNFAKIASLEENPSENGDQFNTSFGLDYLKNFLRQRRTDQVFLRLYNWIDGRTGANSNYSGLDSLEELDHLTLYECLFECCLKILELTENNTVEYQISEQFKLFLNDSEMLANSHSTKENLLLEDIFVGPTLREFDSTKNDVDDVTFSTLLDQLEAKKQIVISGENQSGKTAICKRFFISLFNKGLLPIYISGEENKLQGNFQTLIKNSFCTQYGFESFPEGLDLKQLIPIIDDFHYASNKSKIASELKNFPHHILVVDDIFKINIKNESLIDTHISYMIKEFSPSLRNKLLEKWISLSVDQWTTQNEIYKEIDEKTELIDSALGKIIGKGIMPSFPFFILSYVSSYEAVNKPLDQNITSQGYFYQSLIYIYLRKLGVSNDNFESYINFLTEFSFKLFTKDEPRVTEDEFAQFIEEYKSNYNLTVPEKDLKKNLNATNILNKNSFGEISFSYDYLFFFFIAKYLAENSEAQKSRIEHIIHNLQIDDNAYIAIFISHHDKNSDILEEILLNAMSLFEEFEPAKLTKDELISMDKNIEELVSAVLPEKLDSPDSVRNKRLERKDLIENEEVEEFENEEPVDIELLTQLKRSIKTVEVIGRIIKNRAGSLKFEQLKTMFREAMYLHLRVLTSFLNLIQEDDSLEVIIDVVSKKLESYLEEKDDDDELAELLNDKKKLEDLVRKFFWSMAFSTVYALTDKIIHTLGSNKLTRIVEEVCTTENTPASYIIEKGIYMWYNKSLQIDELANALNDSNYSKTATNILRHLVFNYCQTHSIGYKERQKVESKFGFRTNTFLLTKKSD